MTRDEMRLRLIEAAAPPLIENCAQIEFAAKRSVDFADAVMRCIDARESEISSNLRDAVDRLKAAGARLEAENGGGK